MEKQKLGKAKIHLKLLQLFFVGTVLKDDPRAQFDVNELFDELHNLLLDYEARLGG